MRRLKFRHVADRLQNQPRARRQTVIRWVYFAIIGWLGVWLGDFFFGGLFYLRSEGLVLGEPAVIAAEFPVTVRDLLVREGELVTAGTVAALVSSQNVAETIARLTVEVAGREARLSELRVRGQRVEAILGMAETRQEVTSGARRDLEKLLGRGYLPLDKHTAAVESEFRSRQDLEVLKAEKNVVESEINILGGAFVQAEAAVRELRQLYDEGRMRVPIDGVVSRLVADKGAVVRAGEPLVEIYGKQRFVLAYLPPGALYQLKVGDRVQIKSGLRTVEGVVARIEPFAAALPREFQRAFTPVERHQVIRVEFAPGESPPPLFTKVELRSAEFPTHAIGRIWAKWQSSDEERR